MQFSGIYYLHNVVQLLCLPSSAHFHHPEGPSVLIKQKIPISPSTKPLAIMYPTSVSVDCCRLMDSALSYKRNQTLGELLVWSVSVTFVFLRVTHAVAGVHAPFLGVTA